MSFIPKFELTERIACKASIMLEGLTGDGKSGLALMLGFGLAGGFRPENQDPAKLKEIWKKIFAVDTENKSLNLFIGLPGSWGTAYEKFMSFQLTKDIGYRPSNYLLLREEAVKQNAEVFIADSITHMWNAKGGVLDMVSEYKAAHPKETDNYRVWGQADIAAEKLSIIDTMRHPMVHNIVTVRVKEKFDYQYNTEKKGNDLVSLGEQQLQQGELKYEPDLVLHMLRAGNQDGTKPLAKVIKTRYAIFKKNEEYEFTPELCEQLRAYLEEGVDAEELLEQQRQDYIQAVKEHLDNNAAARPIWQVLKKDAGHETTKLEDIPLNIIKSLYIRLTD
jgi:hypothetical protein